MRPETVTIVMEREAFCEAENRWVTPSDTSKVFLVGPLRFSGLIAFDVGDVMLLNNSQ